MKRETKCDAVRRVLSGGRWVHMAKVQAAGGWRYGARLHDLKARGFGHEVKRDRHGAFWYRRAAR